MLTVFPRKSQQFQKYSLENIVLDLCLSVGRVDSRYFFFKKSVKYEANGETMRVFLGKGEFKANVIDHISVFWPLFA